MYCTRKVTEDRPGSARMTAVLPALRAFTAFPTAFPTTHICSMTKKTVLFDTVDKAVSRTFLKTSPTLWAEGSSIILSFPTWSRTTLRR